MIDIRLFLLIFVVLLSKIISCTKIYLHQIISLAFSILGLIIVLISKILFPENNKSFSLFIMLIEIICSILYYLLI